ncbi:MAG: glycosyltransferase [Acidobacteriota bacterium]
MKVVHINEFDQFGGAATGMWRLHMGLRRLGVNSRVTVAHTSTSDDTVFPLPPWRWRDYQLARLGRRLRFPDVFITSTFDLAQEKVFQEADVVHLHNLHYGYFNYLALPKLLRGKRAFLTLHDMWAITGHCSYSADCTRWQTGCGRCPYPQTYPPMRFDHSALEWRLKRHALKENLAGVFVTSRWMETIARASFLKNIPVYCVPCGLDTEVYQPHNRTICRQLLGLSAEQFVVMFAAMNASDPRKGADLLEAALASIPARQRQQITLLVMGGDTPRSYRRLGCNLALLGRISSDRLKAITYTTADVFVSPAREEAFGLVLQEAMACGTPCVAFAVGGMPDLVRHEVTGLTVAPEDVHGLACAIIRLMEDATLRQQLGAEARNVVLREYTLERQASQALAIYAGTCSA